MTSLLRALLLCGIYAGLLVTSVTGNVANSCGDYELDRTHEIDPQCCDTPCEEALECNISDCNDDESPCDPEDHSDEHHHHHHHTCTPGFTPVAVPAQEFQQLAITSHELTLIAAEHLGVPDAPVLSEDKPPLI